MVVSEQADIGLARSLHHPEVETISLRDDPLILVGRRRGKAMHNHHLTLQDVAEWPLIFFDRGSSDWTLTQSLFRRAGLMPNVVLEVETIEAAKRMVERGLGYAFLPYVAVRQETREGTLSAVKLSDTEPLSRSFDLIHLRNRPLGREALTFLELVKHAAREGPRGSARRARQR